MDEDAGGIAPGGHGHRLLTRSAAAVLRASLLVSPWPSAMALRWLFARWGARRAARLAPHVPHGVRSVLDERFAQAPDALLDVHLPPADGSGPPPTVVWVHGGAFVGGSRSELGPYLRVLASRGLATVAVGYSRAPGAHYPTPVREVASALRFLRQHGDRLGLDPERVVLAGDSAGAHVAAQLAAAATNPCYAAEVGVDPGIEPPHLRGVVLCCGLFDLTAIRDDGPLRHLVASVGWAYAGTRRYRDDERFVATTTLARHVTRSHPPTFLLAGGTDPLAPQSAAMAEALRSRGVAVDTLFPGPGHEPPLGHEYQFDVDLPDGRDALERIAAFCRRCTAPGGAPARTPAG
jgi:acetyl esterase